MSGVKEAPAPWKLKGTSWIFVLPGLSKDASFPAGFAAPHEAEALAEGGEFVGGFGSVQLVSYTESPVGPYDELVYTPGRWKYMNNDPALRVTRIYVSVKESTENGRRNWSLPKQVANFSYRPGPYDTTLFSVSLPSSPDKPFFSASIKPIPLLSSVSILISTTILGKWFSFMQPPLPQGSPENPEEVGTERWAAFTPTMRGKNRLVGVVPGFEDGTIGDGISFPKVKPRSVGAVAADLDIDVGVPVLFDNV